MLIAIPSKGRAGATTTDKFLGDVGTLFVPEAELDQYKQAASCPVVCVPSEVKGITKTRNWILQNTEDQRVVMVDDDLKVQGWRKLYEEKTRHKKMTAGQWAGEFAKFFEVVEDLGWKIWGCKTESSARSVHPYKPFLFRAYVTASCMGIVNDGTYLFDETFPVKEDYEIGLRHVKEFGGVLAVRYVYWENSHWDDDGGCKTYRTQVLERKAIRDLMRLYPGMIKRITRGGSSYSIELNF
jgi:hypothetical protein